MDTNHDYDVYNWLNRMTTGKPLLNQWLPESTQDNHVEELYKNQHDIPSKCLVTIILIFLYFLTFSSVVKRS